MTVYAVMRGTELYRVCATHELAQRFADDYNRTFARGKRATVVSINVVTEEEN